MFVACDESGIDASSKYLIIGTVWIKKQDVSEFEKKVSKLRLDEKCWGEIEWLKLSGTTAKNIIDCYKKFISLAFDDIKIHFRFIIVDKSLIDKKTYHKKSDELVHLKFMHLSISRYADRFLSVNDKLGLHIIFDSFQESNVSKEEKWRLQTKNYIERYLHCKIEHFQPCNSHINSLVQLCDLFTGAVSAVWNKPTAKITKTQSGIIKHIEKLTDKKLDALTLPSARDFNIWVWRPSIDPRKILTH
jgi:hypothetical protein